tara:strand:- start:694 stop:1269 length:576 start_codon:yes stop_codon:yes gene_type:complete
MTNIVELFKTPLYFEDLKLDTKSMKKYIMSIREKNDSVKKSNIGGWQSDNLEGEHPPLNNLFNGIEKHANIFANEIGLKDGLRISNGWININYYKDYNVDHIHGHCMMSGVYYIETPKDCGNIEFSAGDTDLRSLTWSEKRTKEENSFTVPRWWMPAIQNRLYLFPNWLTHRVRPNLNPKKERISISFNLN